MLRYSASSPTYFISNLVSATYYAKGLHATYGHYSTECLYTVYIRIIFIIQLRSTCQLMHLSMTPVPAVLAEIRVV